jgi:hypothetical protein
MALTKRRYTSVDRTTDYIVSASWDDAGLAKTHWFESQVVVVNEATKEKVKLPPFLATYRMGEVEHAFREYVRIDFAGDTEAAVDHILSTLYRRVYQYLERGH